ncbi:TRAM domain-containing protein [Archaeoglobus profundus]|uniref:Deoxyribonuclease/rho motif-related TRAM n=1 Tax=Archaeoglobus profundus (strain DSM 5631 / JCM 9629 / NBRC 100127 / Av18) TaxID=572546 RepID=D2RHN5_ARCPA|nr:TRAM domain-containing protein [Archaeoglobus profundus]ADB57810.1 deoxyribonuclease/rho motif-related TRAM [Archaeoglobus profundus DSM 5631]
MRNLGFSRPPVSVGEVREVKIVAMGSGGDGIAKVNGFVVFVPGTKVGDDVKVKVTKVLKKFAFAEVVE